MSTQGKALGDRYVIRLYQPSDWRQLIEFVNCAWPDSPLMRDEKRIIWRLFENPENPKDSYPLLLIWQGKKIVAQTGWLPFRLFFAGKIIEACWGIDLLVLPEHRRRGLAELFAKKRASMYPVWLSSGLTEASFKLSAKIERPVIGKINTAVKILDMGNFIEQRYNLKLKPFTAAISSIHRAINAIGRKFLNTGIEVQAIEGVTRGLAKFLEDVYSGDIIAPIRTPEWLDWRFFGCPIAEYIMLEARRNKLTVGYAVLRIEEKNRTGHLVDMLTAPDDQDAQKGLLCNAADFLSQKKVARFSCTFLSSLIEKGLHKSGFGERPYKKNLIINPESQPELRDYRLWHVTAADSDIEGF